jgi:hypothetical protein
MSRAMRIVVAAVAALAVAAPAFAQSKSFEKTVAVQPGGSLSVEASKGSVKLSSWDRSQIEIRAQIVAGPMLSADYAQRSVEATSVEVTTIGTAVRIRSNYDKVPPEHGWFGGESRTVPDIHYEIRAPRRLDLRLDIDRSNTTLTGFEGRLDLELDRSELAARDLAGSIRLEIDRGDRSVVENVRGSLRLEADRTRLDVGFAKLDNRSTLRIDRGELRIGVPDRQGLSIDGDISRRADLDSDIPVQIDRDGTGRFTAELNGGGPRLTIYSERAQVTLRR